MKKCPRCSTDNSSSFNFCFQCGLELRSGDVVQDKIEPATQLEKGMTLGSRLEIIDKIGEGGMGIVFKARDLELDDIVALKILNPDLAANTENLERFKREIKIARKIKHPNVCGIYDLLMIEDYNIISMEYIDGIELSSLIYANRFPEDKIIRVILGICMALKAAHDQKIIHRDLKPPNIMIDENFRAIIMDFGIAGLIGSSCEKSDKKIYGTPLYMAPEQILSLKCDERTDIYALGIIIYQLITGNLPFDGQTHAEIIIKQINQPVPVIKLISKKIDPALTHLVSKCLEKKPSDRYQNIDAFLQDLHQLGEKDKTGLTDVKKTTILVVDDDPSIRDLLTSVLTLQGFRVVLAANGEEAMALAWKEEPAIILMDLVMPKMDGHRAAELLSQHQNTSKIPIFLITSKDNRELRAYSKTIGIKQYIPKPFDIPKLVEMIHLHLKMSHFN